MIYQEHKDYFVKERINLLLNISRIMIITMVIMSIIRLIEQNYPQFFVDIIFLVIITAGHFKLKATNEAYKSISRVMFFFAALMALYVIVHQPENPVRFIWLSTIIYMNFYLFERKESVYWIATISILLMLFYMFNPESMQITLVDFSVWFMNMFIVLMIAHWYSKIEEKSIQRLLRIKKLLSIEVKDKTQELEQKKNELEKKTLELQSLNQNLEAKIQEKIQKNREQEEMMFRQARYAQMGEMISMIAHQWRQPLNTISVTSAALEAYVEMDRYEKKFFQEKINVISDSTRHLSSTIDDFRNFFKADKKKQKIPFSDIIQNAIQLTLPSLQKKKIDIETHFECVCCVFSYTNEIIHVILNLLKNAEDALLANNVSDPQIQIRTYADGHMAIMEVEDNAGGISSKIKPKIFDPHFTTKDNRDGTGLGLYMSKIIIEDHCGGTIEVENGKRGAIFRLLIPLYDKGSSCKGKA